MRKRILSILMIITAFAPFMPRAFAANTNASRYSAGWYEENDSYGVYISEISDGSVTFTVNYTGLNGNVIYVTDDITAAIDNDTMYFNWEDSWLNSGNGVMTFGESYITLTMNQTYTASVNRGTLACDAAALYPESADMLAPPAPKEDPNIAGHIYSTDIRAYINGIEVPSYNIDGKTAVIIEDVTGYITGYDYDSAARALHLISLSPSLLKAGASDVSAVTGEVIGDIYKTDIKTYFRDTGIGIPSYNLNGKTAVAIEDLGADGAVSGIGGRYVWDGGARTISLELN